MNHWLWKIISILLIGLWGRCIDGEMVNRANEGPIYLTKLLHHAGIDQQHTSMELGFIVLYLDQYPKIIKTVSKQKNKTEKTFFLPNIEVKEKEVLEAMDRINKEHDVLYSITISQTKIPQKGLKIVLAYNDHQVGVKRHRFTSISLQKAIVFRFYNNQIIEKIQGISKPITQLAFHNPPRVTIDCGHGGADCGAIGCYGIEEKNVSLQVGLQVAQLLKGKNIEVNLTRSEDQTVLLDERTTFANAQKSDLFVSIHANAAPNAHSAGIETYCLCENLFFSDEINSTPMLDRVLGEKYAKSYQLANHVHQAVLTTLASYYNEVNDRRVKHSVAQVLLGTTMPAILVEIGYLTNEKEAILLAQEQYQSFIAHGIVSGIEAYIHRCKAI